MSVRAQPGDVGMEKSWEKALRCHSKGHPTRQDAKNPRVTLKNEASFYVTLPLTGPPLFPTPSLQYLMPASHDVALLQLKPAKLSCALGFSVAQHIKF